MIRILCDNCAQELMKPGAILLSPPDGHECDKFHICIDCYDKLMATLDIWKPPAMKHWDEKQFEQY